MDLQNLRSFIDSQKMRLEEEKAALLIRRPRLDLSEDPVLSKDLKVRNDYGNLKDVRFGSEVCDVLTERINSLNLLKNQSCPLSKSFSESDNTTGKLYPDSVKLNGNNGIDGEDSNHPLTKIDIFSNCKGASTDVGNIEKVNDENSQKSDVLHEALSELEYFINQPSTRSRELEVEKLQEKFSAASFWDGFGQSATGKKWNANVKDTMVRVGEFSPANPDLQAPGKALLGLGEYEERRRQLLEKKKQEYKEYLLSLTRNNLQRTNHHLQPPTNSYGRSNSHLDLLSTDEIHSNTLNSVDVGTQTDVWVVQHTQPEISSKSAAPSQFICSTLSPGEPTLQQLSPREKHNMELRHHCAPCFVPRVHSSQTMEQLPDARLRQLQLQEELRWQIEEKRRLEAERRDQEKLEDEALQRRVAEQQARLKAEYERDEKLRHEREIQKQQQIEEFQRRQEELRAESEALKQEGRRKKLEAAESHCRILDQEILPDSSKGVKNAHLVPPSEPDSVSILKSPSPPRSPRIFAGSSKFTNKPPNTEPVSPRALIKVLEGPSVFKRTSRLEDSLPIPLMPVAHSQTAYRSPKRSPNVSPQLSPRRSPRQSPSRFVLDQDWINVSAPLHTRPSEAMQNLEERWKVPAVQKNLCVRGKRDVQNGGTSNVLTQLGAFRRQLQMEHMRMEENVRERHQPVQYHQQHFQQHAGKKRLNL